MQGRSVLAGGDSSPPRRSLGARAASSAGQPSRITLRGASGLSRSDGPAFRRPESTSRPAGESIAGTHPTRPELRRKVSENRVLTMPKRLTGRRASDYFFGPGRRVRRVCTRSPEELWIVGEVPKRVGAGSL